MSCIIISCMYSYPLTANYLCKCFLDFESSVSCLIDMFPVTEWYGPGRVCGLCSAYWCVAPHRSLSSTGRPSSCPAETWRASPCPRVRPWERPYIACRVSTPRARASATASAASTWLWIGRAESSLFCGRWTGNHLTWWRSSSALLVSQQWVYDI